jgi:hypothetical protein
MGAPADGVLRGPEETLRRLALEGIRTVADVLERSECVRDLPDRSNHVLRAGGEVVIVKRTKPRGLLGRVPAVPPEAAGIAAARAAGVPTAEVALSGVDRRLGAVTGTRDLAPARPLDELLREGRLSAEAVAALLASLSRAVAALHAARLHHRDLYLNHVYAVPSAGRVVLIDWERARRHRGALGRAVVKDLAAIEASIPPGTVGDREKGRFLVRYLAARGMPVRALAVPLARRIEAKAARIRAHVPRTPVGEAARPP